MIEDDDFSFVRNYLTEDLAEELGLFGYTAKRNGEVKVEETDINDLRESLLSAKFNFGAPTVGAVKLQTDGTLELRHAHNIDGRGLDAQRSAKALEYIHRVWRRPVVLYTQDERGEQKVLTAGNS
jgi:stage V sporulation protein R